MAECLVLLQDTDLAHAEIQPIAAKMARLLVSAELDAARKAARAAQLREDDERQCEYCSCLSDSMSCIVTARLCFEAYAKTFVQV